MKQQDPERLKQGLEMLDELKRQRGGKLLSFHKKAANDAALLKAFSQQYEICNGEAYTAMPRKYRELILMALGCAKGVPVTVNTHAKLAMENGATVEEIGEVLRLIFFYLGASQLIPSVEIFEELPGSESL